MASVNTNYGASIALQNLNSTNKQLETVQARINTGLKVASAKDDGAVYAIAQSQRADVSGLNVAKASIDKASSIVDVATAAGEAISDLLVQMKEKATAAADASLTSTQRSAYNEDFTALRDQITSIVSNADFSGINLVNGSTTQIQAFANASASSYITVTSANFSLGGAGAPLAAITATVSVSTQAQAAALVTSLDSAIDSLNQDLARLGSRGKALEVHSNFVTKLADTMNKGIGNLVDADLAAESAKLQSLQVKQQLGAQALSIANQAPGSILSFFR